VIGFILTLMTCKKYSFLDDCRVAGGGLEGKMEVK